MLSFSMSAIRLEAALRVSMTASPYVGLPFKVAAKCAKTEPDHG